MAFSDAPIVDRNSILSEQSLLQVKQVLSRANGFISREETPDYGADLDVELVLNEQEASSQKFAVQIKSTVKADTITLDGENFIKLSFETSRLGYLCNRLPAYGIIVLYEGVSKTCYFDYVEDIVQRITHRQGDVNWKQQKTVCALP